MGAIKELHLKLTWQTKFSVNSRSYYFKKKRKSLLHPFTNTRWFSKGYFLLLIPTDFREAKHCIFEDMSTEAKIKINFEMGYNDSSKKH